MSPVKLVRTRYNPVEPRPRQTPFNTSIISRLNSCLRTYLLKVKCPAMRYTL